MSLDRDVVDGRYRLIDLLGRGGMGVVYRAHDERLGRDVALKLISSDLASDEEFRARFMREMRVAARLEHRHIVPVYETGEPADGELFIAMRLINGPSLAERLGSGPIPADETATIIRHVCAALDEAHAAGLVHRDVKPANILLERSGGEHAYLADFGLAREAASTTALTNTGQWMGTVDYVAPEQLDAGRVSARTDIYAVGCIAYQCLTGDLPFNGTVARKLAGHAAQPFPSITHGVAHPHHVDAVLQRACAKDPDDRFQSAGDLARALQAAIAGASVDQPERTVAIGVALTGLETDTAATKVVAARHVPRTPRPPRTIVAVPATPAPSASALEAPKRSRWPLVGGVCALALIGAGVAFAATSGNNASPVDSADATGTRSTSASAPEPKIKTVTVTRMRTTASTKTVVTSVSPAPAMVHCDTNIEAQASNSSCPFALNTFWEYWNSDSATSLQVWSPARKKFFDTTCEPDGNTVICSTPQGTRVQFPQRAVDEYSHDLADKYARTGNLGPRH